MAPTRRASLLATVLLGGSAALAACTSAAPTASSLASTAITATPAATAGATALPASTPPASVAASASASAGASSAASQLPIATPVPGSSLDVSLSDAGVAGRITIVGDTRPERIGTDDHTGTSEILGHEADNSDCSFSLSGDAFTAVAWYDDAPTGMLHQMAVRVSTDFIPVNDGEQRAGISDGRVYADFASESGFGTVYSGDSTEETNGGTSTIDVERAGDTLVFTFTGTTWDDIDFAGQMMCSGMSE